MDYSDVYQQLITKFPQTDIKRNHPLAPYTTLKIGGPADIFIHTHTSDEFLNVLKFLNESDEAKDNEGTEAKDKNGEDNVFFGAQSSEQSEGASTTKKPLSSQNITVLGNGSNVLISDSGIRGIVIKNSSQEIELLPDNKVKVSSGTQLPYLINYTLDHNLLGLEEFAYIPSTVGGAIAGNIHGLHGHFSDYIDSVENYNSFIISTILKLTPGDSTQAKIQVQETIQKKSLTQSMNSAGCTFKNPSPENPAGLIIDQKLGLKGKIIGGTQISPLHANFIINTGNATAKDCLNLIQLIQSQMQTKLGFQFELEIKLLGEF